MKLSKDKIIFRAPRVLSILFLLFLAIFSLDVFDEGLGFWGTLLGLFMHNLPAIVLAVVLAVAWKHELVGAVFYALAGLVYTITVVIGGLHGSFKLYKISWIITIAGPAFLIAWLFFVGWRMKCQIKTPKP